MGNKAAYREIDGCPGYRVGDDGSVWSRRPRNGKGGVLGAWRRIKPCADRRGYLRINVGGPARAQVRRKVHKLVIEAFVGPCPPGMEVCHNDGNPSNCALSNLRYDTHKNNHADGIVHGTASRGKSSSAKLTDELVRSMRADWESGQFSQGQLAKKYRICQPNVCLIVNHRGWKHAG